MRRLYNLFELYETKPIVWQDGTNHEMVIWNTDTGVLENLTNTFTLNTGGWHWKVTNIWSPTCITSLSHANEVSGRWMRNVTEIDDED